MIVFWDCYHFVKGNMLQDNSPSVFADVKGALISDFVQIKIVKLLIHLLNGDLLNDYTRAIQYRQVQKCVRHVQTELEASKSRYRN